LGGADSIRLELTLTFCHRSSVLTALTVTDVPVFHKLWWALIQLLPVVPMYMYHLFCFCT